MLEFEQKRQELITKRRKELEEKNNNINQNQSGGKTNRINLIKNNNKTK